MILFDYHIFLIKNISCIKSENIESIKIKTDNTVIIVLLTFCVLIWLDMLFIKTIKTEFTII